MHERIRAALNRKVTMPRWAVGLDFVYRALLVVGSVIVVVLWWQAATRDEEADRNARIQSCTSEYAATTAAWDARVLAIDEHGEALLARLIVQAAEGGGISPGLLRDYRDVTDQAASAAGQVDAMARRRIALAQYAAESAAAGNDFECPALPAGLTVEAAES